MKFPFEIPVRSTGNCDNVGPAFAAASCARFAPTTSELWRVQTFTSFTSLFEDIWRKHKLQVSKEKDPQLIRTSQ